MLTRLTILLSIVIAASPASAQWQPDGMSVGGGGVPQIIPDGSGGAMVTWEDWDPWTAQWDFARGQRLAAGGNTLWQPYGQYLCGSSFQNLPQLVSDGADGAIFVWLDNRNGHLDIYAQRLNASGAEQWAPCGVPVRVLPIDVAYGDLAVVSDGSGGAIIAWSDPRGGAGTDIYAQHIDATGTALWTTNGGALCTAAQGQAKPVTVADGSGGVWVAWVDNRSGSNSDIYARHINGNGVPEGVANGLALCTAAGHQTAATIAPDESGGATVAWQDARGGSNIDDVYAQRVSSAGTMLWTTDGVGVCTQTNAQVTPDIASDGAGGAVVVWMDWRSYPDVLAAYAQRVNGAGVIQWTADGNLLGSTLPGTGYPAIIPDASGQSIVAWGENKWNDVLLQTESIVRVQRLGADGAAQWISGGVDVSNAGPAERFALVSDGWGGAIVAWQDWRYWQASAVYAGHVSPAGVATDVGPVRGPSLMVANVYPNPFSRDASIAIELTTPSRLDIDVFDVAGRRVRSLVQNDGNLSHVVELNGRDDAGRLLPSGVYFCRVRTAGETVTRKMVITR